LAFARVSYALNLSDFVQYSPETISAVYDFGMTYRHSDKIRAELLARVSVDETLRSICRDEAMPTFQAVYRWMRNNPDFARDYQKACDTGYEAIAQDCLAIADESIASSEQLGRNKLRVSTRLALLGKWSKRYADKQQVTLSADEYIADAILAARKRARLSASE